MDELNFNDEVQLPKHNRSGYGSSMKPEQKRIQKQNRLREIEQRLEEQRLRKELGEIFC